MRNHEQNDSFEALESDPVWDLLERAGEVDVSPFFARNVVREIRLQEDQNTRGGLIGWISGNLKQRAVAAGFAVAVACVVLVFGVSRIQREEADSFAASAVEVEQSDEAILESDREVASEIEAVEYLGQLMAVADPGELSDAALADLLF